jgi:Zn-dependent peptidase ImmA (M78 family)
VFKIDLEIENDLEILAAQERSKIASDMFLDIFDVIEENAILVLYPFESKKISGFSTYYHDEFIVIINTNYTLGHQIYTAAHEYYHLVQDHHKLMTGEVLEADEENEEKANVFASLFLMPEQSVKKQFYKLAPSVNPSEVEPRHIVRMHNKFRVSYKAMLKRLVKIGLCAPEKYDELREMGTLENHEKLVKLTEREGFDVSLIKPSGRNHVSEEWIQKTRENFEQGLISYSLLQELLEFIGKDPGDYGYLPPKTV